MLLCNVEALWTQCTRLSHREPDHREKKGGRKKEGGVRREGEHKRKQQKTTGEKTNMSREERREAKEL